LRHGQFDLSFLKCSGTQRFADFVARSFVAGFPIVVTGLFHCISDRLISDPFFEQSLLGSV